MQARHQKLWPPLCTQDSTAESHQLAMSHHQTGGGVSKAHGRETDFLCRKYSAGFLLDGDACTCRCKHLTNQIVCKEPSYNNQNNLSYKDVKGKILQVKHCYRKGTELVQVPYLPAPPPKFLKKPPSVL